MCILAKHTWKQCVVTAFSIQSVVTRYACGVIQVIKSKGKVQHFTGARIYQKIK